MMIKREDFLESLRGFSKLNQKERMRRLLNLGFLSEQDVRYFESGQEGEGELFAKQRELSDHLIENAIGCFHLPLGLALNFIINGKPYIIPMAMEESSVIASASKTARWICSQGEIQTEIQGENLSTEQSSAYLKGINQTHTKNQEASLKGKNPKGENLKTESPTRENPTGQWLSTGQIQIPRMKSSLAQLKACIQKNFPHWQSKVHKGGPLSSMFKRGGGLKSWELRSLRRPLNQTEDQTKNQTGNQTENQTEDQTRNQTGKDGFIGVLHLFIDTREAMGANIINQTCEYLRPYIEKDCGEKTLLCILSNLSDRRISRARVTVRNQDPALIQKIEEASLFAEVDPYRAATSNKGVLNAVDGLLIATGNDWRAVEAGLHSYCCRKGRYSSLTRWRAKGSTLYGEMEGPFMLGTVGGVTSIHPTAKRCLSLLGEPSAKKLSGIACAVGLVQNLAALRALVTDGISKGHLKLHVKNLALKAGAKTPPELNFLKGYLSQQLNEKRRPSLKEATLALKDFREGKFSD